MTLRPFVLTALSLLLAGCGQPMDSAAVGTWHAPAVGIYWEIREDGTYEITQTNGTLMNGGEIDIADGEWSINAPNWQDAGNYTIAEDTLNITSRLGPSSWVRVDPAERQLVLMRLDDFRQGDPIAVLPALQRIGDKVRAWQADAILSKVSYQERDYGSRLSFEFCSPYSGKGFRATVFDEMTHFDEVSPRGWCTDSDRELYAVPRVFLDLPAAVGIARRDGELRGPVRAARLRVWEASEEPILAWVIEGREWINVEATTGVLVDGDLTGAAAYIDWYNETWAEAVKGLQRLFRPPRRTSSGGYSYDYSSDGDGYTDDDDADWRSDYQQSVCESNAYWSSDPGAYGRSQSGSTTWSDASNYGC